MIELNFTKDELTLFQRISNSLDELGLMPSTKGYNYLRHAIFMGATDREAGYHVTTQIFPKIATMFDTKPINVEKACRCAVDGTYLRCGAKKINEVMEIKYLQPHEKPTLLGFITTFIEKHFNFYSKLCRGVLNEEIESCNDNAAQAEEAF